MNDKEYIKQIEDDCAYARKGWREEKAKRIEVEKRVARMDDALKKCDEEFDTLAQVGTDELDYARYTGLRSMIEEARKEWLDKRE
jgi:hypothetical protein